MLLDMSEHQESGLHACMHACCSTAAEVRGDDGCGAPDDDANKDDEPPDHKLAGVGGQVLQRLDLPAWLASVLAASLPLALTPRLGPCIDLLAWPHAVTHPCPLCCMCTRQECCGVAR